MKQGQEDAACSCPKIKNAHRALSVFKMQQPVFHRRFGFKTRLEDGRVQLEGEIIEGRFAKDALQRLPLEATRDHLIKGFSVAIRTRKDQIDFFLGVVYSGSSKAVPKVGL